MIKTEICKGDKVRIVQGEGRHLVDAQKQPLLCTVLQVNRTTGRVLLEVPRPKARRGEKEKPRRGVELYKTARYNPKAGEQGGLKIVKKPVHISNLVIVERAPRREFGA